MKKRNRRGLALLPMIGLFLALCACSAAGTVPAGSTPTPTEASVPAETPEPDVIPVSDETPEPDAAPDPAGTFEPATASDLTPDPAQPLARRLTGRWAAPVRGEGFEDEWYTLEIVEFCGNLYAQAAMAVADEGEETLEPYSFCALELIPRQASRLLDEKGNSCQFGYLAFSVMSNLSRWWGEALPCTLTLTEEGLLFAADGGLPLASDESLLLTRDERVAAAFPYAEELPFETEGEEPPEELYGLWMEAESEEPLFLSIAPGEAGGPMRIICYDKQCGREVSLDIGGGVWQDGTITAFTSSLGSGTMPRQWEAEATQQGDILILSSQWSELPGRGEGELRLERADEARVPVAALTEETAEGRIVFAESGPEVFGSEAPAAYRELVTRLRLSWKEQWDEDRMLEEFGYTGFLECGWPQWAEDINELGYACCDMNGDGIPELIVSYLSKPADVYSFDGSGAVHTYGRGLSETMTLYQDGMIFGQAGGGGELWETWYRISSLSGRAIPITEHILTMTPEGDRDEWYIFSGAVNMDAAEEIYAQYGQYPVWIWEWEDMVDEETYNSYASSAPELEPPAVVPLSEEAEYAYWPRY